MPSIQSVSRSASSSRAETRDPSIPHPPCTEATGGNPADLSAEVLAQVDFNAIKSGSLRISVPLRAGLYELPGLYEDAKVRVEPDTMAWLDVSLGKNGWNETVFTHISTELSRAIIVTNPSSAYEAPGWCNGIKDLFADLQIEGIDVSSEGQILFQGKIKKGFVCDDIKTAFKPEMFPKINLCLEALKKPKQDSEPPGLAPEKPLNPTELLKKFGHLLGELKCSGRVDMVTQGLGVGLHVKARLTTEGKFQLKTDEQYQSSVDFLETQAVLTGDLQVNAKFQPSKPTQISGSGMVDVRVAESKPLVMGALKTKFQSAHVNLQAKGEISGKNKSASGSLQAEVSDPEFEWRGLLGYVHGKAGLRIQVKDLMSGAVDYRLESDRLAPFKRSLGYQFFPDGRLSLNPHTTGMSGFLDPTSQFVWNVRDLADPSGESVGDVGSAAWRDRVQILTGAPIRQNNKVTLLIDGQDSFPKRLELIKNAKRSICLQSLIFKDDESGMVMAKALVEACKRGVQVHVIVDSLGNLDSLKSLIRGNGVYKYLRENDVRLELYSNLAIRGLRDMLEIVERHDALSGIVSLQDFMNPEQVLSTLHLLVKVSYGVLNLNLTEIEREKIRDSLKMILGNDEHAGVLIRRLLNITPENPIQISEIIEILTQVLSLNRRWHEKYLVVDGEKAILGGMNLADEYMKGGLASEVMVAGISRPAWRDTDILIEGEGAYDAYGCFARNWKEVSGKELDPELMPSVNSENNIRLQVIQSTPGIGISHPITNLKIEALKSLKAGDKAYEATAYFVPMGALKPYVEALKLAALRGVDVRIVTNSRDTTDMPHVNKAAAVSCYRELLKAGVRIFERTGTRTMHQKTAAYGSQVALVGSFNLDNRSASLNSESLVVVHDANVAGDVERMLLRDMESDVAVEKKFEDYEAFDPIDEIGHSAWAMLGDLM